MTLFLIDAHALAYRSHFAFARNPLVDSRGRVTSAVFGFARTLLSLQKEHRPRHLGVVFDPPDKTFRHEIYPEYKATREKMPDELRDQIPLIHEMLEVFGIPAVTLPRFEADDVVATLATRAESLGMDARILSGDKDFYQLLSKRIRLLRPDRRGGGFEDFGPDEFVARFGFPPEHMVDYLGLMGDVSDNVPGVPGVGEKTARSLVLEFGSIETLYDRLDRVTRGRLRETLQSHEEAARLSKRLVTMDRAAPVDLAPEDLRVEPPDPGRVAALFGELEFHSLLGELGRSGDPPLAGPAPRYRCVEGEEELRALAAKLSETDKWAVDVETTSVDALATELVGISFGVGTGEAFYVPVSLETDAGPLFAGEEGHSAGFPLSDIRRLLGPVLADAGKKKIGQNIKFDWLVLESHDLTLEGIAFDTMLASYCLDPGQGSHGLDALALRHLGHKMIPFADLFEKKSGPKNIRRVPLARVCEYACEDADMTYRLEEIFAPLLRESGVEALFEEVEMPLMRVLKGMEWEGVTLDVSFLATMGEALARDLERLIRTIHDLAGEDFNLNSTQQLRRVLFEKLGLPARRRTKTGYSTDADVLAELGKEHELPRRLLEYRELQKLKSTYVDALPKLVNGKTGRLHTSFNQAVAATGRLSSSDPNLQNIPIRSETGREIRKAFVHREGFASLLDADYSQVELRILAHLTGDPQLTAAFREGADIHRRTAARILGVDEAAVTDEMRSRAKAVNFGVIYGMGARGLAANLGVPLDEAQGFIDEYFEIYPGVKQLVEETIESARREKVVYTLLGRRRFLPDIDSVNPRLRSFSERIAVNTIVQGSAADMIKVAMIRIDEGIHGLGLRSRMILQVHDELVFDVAPGEEGELAALVEKEMSRSLDLDVPVVVDAGFGPNWFEAH